MGETKWILCPVYGNKIRMKIRKDTELIYFPLFCPKCKREMPINAKNFSTTLIGESDAKMQCHRYPLGS